MMGDSIRVLLVDDQVVVRRGMAMLLLAVDDLLLVGAAQNGTEAMALCEAAQPDVVLMDLLMPGMDGVEATRAIRERFPHIRVIALTDWGEYELVQRALATGAEGYLFKSSSASELAVAIRTAYAADEQEATTPQEKAWSEHEREVLALMLQGLTSEQITVELTIERASLRSCMETILVKIEDMVHATEEPEPATEPEKPLTEREREVLGLMAQGLTNPQIGDDLFIAAATAKFHVSSILSKLGAATRTEAVALAIQRNLIDGSQ